MAGYGYVYGYTNNRGNFNTYKAMERHMDGNGYHDKAHPSYAHSYPPTAGESFLSTKDNNNGGEQDLFEKVRMQVTQMSHRRNNWWVKPSNGKNITTHQSNGEYDHHNPNNGLQNGKYNSFYATQGGAQRVRFGAPASKQAKKEL